MDAHTQHIAAFLADPNAAVQIDDWRGFFGSAKRHGVANLLLLRFREQGVAIPAEVAVEADAWAIAAELGFPAFTDGLKVALAALQGAGLRAMPLKGPALAARLYDPIWLRRSSDLDVLIVGDLRAGIEALAVHGWERPPELDLQRRHVAMEHPRWPAVELHYRAHHGFGTTIEADRLFAGARTDTSLGYAIEVPDPLTEWVYLAAHAAAHRFVRLSWLEDLRRLRAREALGADALLDRGRSMGLVRPTRLGLALLGESAAECNATRLVRPMLFTRGATKALDSALNAAAQTILADGPGRLVRTIRHKVVVDLPQRLRRT